MLDFYRELAVDEELLPPNTAVMNPYRDRPEVDRILNLFYSRYYGDQAPRGLILGINPGRKGAGQTGIPFTDTPALHEHCGLETNIDTKETSADFVYRLIESYGGPQVFYRDWLIGAACPLGFTHRNAQGNWVNWNYYDDAVLWKNLRPFMAQQLQKQWEICGRPKQAVVWGKGKNWEFVNKLNRELKLFDALIALEHPRFVMQYRRKRLAEYLQKFVEVLQANRPVAG